MPAPADRALPSRHVTDRYAAGGMAAVALFAATGHLGLELVSNFLPIVYPILVAEAGFSFAQVGTVTLVATLGMTLPQPLFGMLVRRFDAGRLVIAAVLWCGLFYGLVGLAGSFWPLLAVVTLGGWVRRCSTRPARWWRRRRAAGGGARRCRSSRWAAMPARRSARCCWPR